jgi:hypothetical protein
MGLCVSRIVQPDLVYKDLNGYLDKCRTPTIAPLAKVILDLDVHAIRAGHQPKDSHVIHLEQSILGHLDTRTGHVDFGRTRVIIHHPA